MKVIKRDGRAVDYNRKKIEIAIGKANEEVTLQERASDEDIKSIVEYIEFLNRKRMLVEDIQDIIEKKLMELKKYDLAKKYIVYRYTRALVRKQNNTDESILGFIRNESKEINEDKINLNTNLPSMQRDYIASEVSRDLTKRLLLPEKIANADKDGIIHFHDADYFIQPMINSSSIDIGYLLKNGLTINEYPIKAPTNFREACQTLLDIIFDVANNQYGIQIDDISCLSEYLKNNTQEEINNSIRFLKQHLNTTIINGKLVHVKFLINLNSNYNKNKKLADVIQEIQLANNKNILLEIINEQQNKDEIAKFDQGKVSINLVQPAIIFNENKDMFYNELKNRLELCKEALMCKHYALLGTSSDVSPILWQNGGIARLEKREKIDNLLKDGNSTLTLGYIGLEECAKLLCQDNIEETKNNIIQTMIEATQEWTKETGIKFVLGNNCSKKVSNKLLKIDKEKFGIIKSITDKEYYQ